MNCDMCGGDMIKHKKTEIYKCDCGQLQHSGKSFKHDKERYILPQAYIYNNEARELNPYGDLVGFK